MLKFIGVKNFKTLLSTNFPLQRLNVFSGLNGMGKSSLIQTLLLLRQSYERGALLDKGLLLNGDYIDVGSGIDALAMDAENEFFQFTIKWSELEVPQVFRFDYDASSDLQPSSPDGVINGDLSQLSLFNQKFHYLNAERLSPSSQHQLSEFHIRDLNSLGNHGEFTVHFIAVNASKQLNLEGLQHPKANTKDLLSNIEAWMSEISPGLKVRAAVQPIFNLATLNFAFEQGNDITREFRPQHVGFGLSYVLPVITSILCAKSGDLVVIENPESHLHPAGQAMLGRLCALAAHEGVQLIVESHSDHFLNGIRVAVKDKVIDSGKVALFFLEREINGMVHESNVFCPKIDDDGRIDQWPKGFFDEWDNQLDRLL